VSAAPRRRRAPATAKWISDRQAAYPPTDGLDPEESGIPALYSYLGQFIDHDTFDPVSMPTGMQDPEWLVTSG
jgi:hypothetical protein